MSAIRITTGRRGARIVACALPQVEKMLHRVPGVRAPDIVRRLHGICREAQGLAADLAIAAAQGEVIPPETLAAATLRAHAEALRETALRLCLDWPTLIGEAPQTELARDILALTRVAAPDAAALVRWHEGVLATGLPDRLLAAAPAHLAPAFGDRLAALAGLPGMMAAGAPLPPGASPAPGQGMATVPTARGPLTHRVRLELGVVSAYVIDAPTARRFAPRGDAAALLRRAHTVADAQWAMHAIDPCVLWSIDPVAEAA